MPSSSDRAILAIDLGSTWCKAAYLDPFGKVLAQGRTYTRFGDGYGVDEAALERLWRALANAVRQASVEAELSGMPPTAIGFSCRGGNGIWLDEQDIAIGLPDKPPPLSAEDTAEVYEAPVWGEAGAFAYAYTPVAIAHTRWLRRAWPDQWARVTRVVSLHDWVIHRLCGVWVTDPASGPGYHQVPAAAAALCGLPVAAFPPVRDFAAPLAPLTADAAHELGLPRAAVVVCGCHDGVAANLGAGAIGLGDACLTLGSSLVLRVVSDRQMPNVFGYPIAPERWAWVRGVHGIAAQLDAVVSAIDGVPPPVSPERHQNCLVAAQTVPIGSNGWRLPVLPRGSEAQQYEIARQALSAGAKPGELYRAALEGAAAAMRGLVEVAREDGALPRRYFVTGAMTANPLLLNVLSAMLAAPLALADPESGVRGAAMLAAIGAGWYANVAEAGRRMTRPHPTIEATARDIVGYAEWRRDQPVVRGAAPRAADWMRPVSMKEAG